MTSLLDLAVRFEKLQDILDKPSQAVDSGPSVAKSIIDSSRVFLAKLEIPLSRLNSKEPGLFTKKDSRYYVDGESRTIDFDYDSALDIAKQAVTTINDALKNLMVSINSRDKVRLGVALNTFYKIVDNISSLEKEAKKELSKASGDDNKEKEDASNQLEKLKKEIDDYFAAPSDDIRSLKVDEAYEQIASGNVEFSHRIAIGKTSANFSSKFKKYLNEKGYRLEGGDVHYLSFNEGENLFHIDVDASFLRRNNDFEDSLREIIFASFVNFGEKEYQVAFVEGEDGEVILGPIADFVKEGSSDYIYGGDVADTKEKTSRLIKDLNEEIRNRIRLFKTSRNLLRKDIEHYNESNRDNPLRYIFLVIKDYPSGFDNSDIREKLENIILDGASTGVAVLLIGKNEELSTGFSTKIQPLNIPDNCVAKEADNKTLTNNGVLFKLMEPHYNFDDIELMKKRLKNASNFSLSTILEETPNVPHYEEIAIPLGKSGSDVYSLIAHTEKPPYPFVLVTGSTGTGKSAFMHEIILSGAYKYSPDELEFHVIDFKSAEQATEFALYKDGEELYIPHVKYLSLKSRPENALDIISYIQKLKSKRNRLGKFKQYNQEHPEKKTPLIYVIIDEYESMLAGGENAGNDYESISLQSSIQDGVTKILKTARAFGIGLILSGQATKGLPADAFAQLSTFITFNNKENVISKIHPGENLNLSLFPTDDFRGLAFTSSNGSTPKFTKFAWVGNQAKMAALAEKIRNKYPEHSAKHVQSIIGGTSSARLRLDSYLTWKEEIDNRILDAEGDYDNKEQFLSSKQDTIIKRYRPLAIGQSSSSENTVYLDYQKDENGHNFFAFGRNENLCPIERNLMLSFLYQAAELQLKDKHIIFMDGTENGIKNQVFGSLLEKYPFIFKQIEYINDRVAIARKLLSLSKHLKENEDNNPYFIVMHEISWLNGQDYLPRPKEIKSKENNDAANKEVQAQLNNAASSGIKVPSFLFSAGAVSKPVEKEEEFESYGIVEVKNAFKNLYLNGMLHEHFMLVSSSKYSVLNDYVITSVNDSHAQNAIKNYSIYGSFDMLKNHDVGDRVNANICYVLDGKDARSTVRLFDYESTNAKEWWERLEKMMFYWR